MPNPISGTAVALAATQLRIINLDQVLDTNISTSMNFAIDFANQTFRMTGLQFTDYLNQSLAISAGNVGFDNAIFQSVFPLEPTPPTNAQDVIDYGLPILANADAGNIGKLSIELETIEPNLGKGGFYSASSTAPNNPALSGIAIFQSGYNTNRLHALYGDVTGNRLWHKGGGTDTTVSNEIFSSSTRTSAEANTILDNAERSNVGKDTTPSIPSVEVALPIGFYATDADATGVPVPATIGKLLQIDLNCAIWIENRTTNAKVFYGVRAASTGAYLWVTLATTTDLTAYLPLAGGTVTGQIKGIVPVAAEDLTRKSYVDAGVFPAATTAVGDVTAFLGVAVVAQPSIAATGVTTAYDLIELLLDKVDELETRLANAGIA